VHDVLDKIAKFIEKRRYLSVVIFQIFQASENRYQLVSSRSSRSIYSARLITLRCVSVRETCIYSDLLFIQRYNLLCEIEIFLSRNCLLIFVEKIVYKSVDTYSILL